MSHTAEEPRAGSSTRTLFIICVSLGTVVSAVASLNVAIPSLALETRASNTELTWIVDAYALVFAALLLPCGALGDRYGRKRALIVGLTIFGLAATGAIFTDSVGWLITLRSLLGVGAALVMPATLSTITSTFPANERARAVGAWAGVAGASAIIGLLASGLLLEFWSWRGVFAFNASLAALSLIGVIRGVGESASRDTPPIDKIGSLLTISGLGILVFAIIEAPSEGWTSLHTITGLVTGLVLLTAFVVWELRTKHPLLDPRLFRSSSFTAGTLTIACQFFAFFGFIFIILQYLQLIQAHSPLNAALRMLPLAIGLMAAARGIAPRVAAHVGGRRVSITGLLVAAATSACLTYLSPNTSYWAISAALLTLGIGMGLAMTPATSAITSALSSEQQGVGSAVNDLSRELGGTLGIAVMASVLISSYKNSLADMSGLTVNGPLAEQIRRSPGLAMHIAPQLHSHIEAAFMDGMQAAFIVAAAVLGGAAITTIGLAIGSRKDPGTPSDRAGSAGAMQ